MPLLLEIFLRGSKWAPLLVHGLESEGDVKLEYLLFRFMRRSLRIRQAVGFK